MFESTGVMTRKELEARNEVKWDMYTKKIQIEARVLGDLVMNHVVPVAIEYQTKLIDNAYKMKSLFSEEEAQTLSAENLAIIKEISEHTSFIKKHVDEMVEARKVANRITSEREKAIAYHDTVAPMLEQIRYHIDKLELIVDDHSDIQVLPLFYHPRKTFIGQIGDESLSGISFLHTFSNILSDTKELFSTKYISLQHGMAN